MPQVRHVASAYVGCPGVRATTMDGVRTRSSAPVPVPGREAAAPAAAWSAPVRVPGRGAAAPAAGRVARAARAGRPPSWCSTRVSPPSSCWSRRSSVRPRPSSCRWSWRRQRPGRRRLPRLLRRPARPATPTQERCRSGSSGRRRCARRGCCRTWRAAAASACRWASARSASRRAVSSAAMLMVAPVAATAPTVIPPVRTVRMRRVRSRSRGVSRCWGRRRLRGTGQAWLPAYEGPLIAPSRADQAR